MEVITPGLKPKLNVETEVSAYDKMNATLQIGRASCRERV